MDKVRSLLPAADILRDFDAEEYQTTSYNYPFFFQRILSTAREHNHSELIALLCEDPGRHSKCLSMLIVQSPLAFTFSDLTLMEMFLRAGAPVIWTTHPYPMLLSKPTDLFVLSIIEQACVLDHPDALKLLLSYDTDQNPER